MCIRDRIGGRHRARGRAVPIVVHRTLAERAALLEHEARRGVLGEFHSRGIDALAADEGVDVLAMWVRTELAVPGHIVTEPREGDGDVALGPAEALFVCLLVFHWTRLLGAE